MDRVFPEALQRLKARLPGRRFVVGMFHFVSGHWVSFMFDRLHFHLFVFDTLASDSRERLEMVATAWQQTLLDLGYAVSSIVVGVRACAQQNAWACGYLSALCLLQVIRAFSGPTVKAITQARVATIDKAMDKASAKAIHEALGKSDLVLPDWPLGAEAEAEGLRRARSLLLAMLANELGIA
ncbi:hypothetical protein OCS_03336 [Ophiocordyceps sinensis CO18]|uniref:Ubiquitin-like protease family profile domain-containing protein n=1 Tax=Ophiocordyceps sinensis (strain Co18 / CGMCC 3.14243) TaxID=911162 RepID=T5AGR3_OPHSC|nr:hypothetical protein OCS_03336 [Ophiocordyceps sinensis CO18]